MDSLVLNRRPPAVPDRIPRDPVPASRGQPGLPSRRVMREFLVAASQPPTRGKLRIIGDAESDGLNPRRRIRVAQDQVGNGAGSPGLRPEGVVLLARGIRGVGAIDSTVVRNALVTSRGVVKRQPCLVLGPPEDDGGESKECNKGEDGFLHRNGSMPMYLHHARRDAFSLTAVRMRVLKCGPLGTASRPIPRSSSPPLVPAATSSHPWGSQLALQCHNVRIDPLLCNLAVTNTKNTDFHNINLLPRRGLPQKAALVGSG